MLDVQKVDELAKKLLEAKRIEKEAEEARIKIEQEIIDLIGEKFEGDTSVKGEKYKLKTTGKVSRTFDNEKIRENYNDLPDEVKDVIVIKYSVDLKKYRKIENHEKFGKLLSLFMTVKKNKTAVSVSEI